MKIPARTIGALGAMIAMVAPLAAQADDAPGQVPRHVVMISIDGLRPEIYLDPERAGVHVPNLVQLRDEGTSAEGLIPVFPSVTYPGHTSLVTGVYPATHGIVSNFKHGQEWYTHASDIKSTTLWQAAHNNKLVTAIVTWPASYGAKVDYLIPENLSFNVKDVPQLIRAGSTPGLFEHLEATLGPVEVGSFEQDEAGEQLDRMTGAFAAQILREYQPNLLLLHFLDADHREHGNGPNSAEARLAFEMIDGQIGALRQAAKDAGILDSTIFVIVGDHGFVPVHTSINVNGLLAATGYGSVTADGTFTAPDVIAMPIGGAAAFYLAHPDDTELAERLAASLQLELQQRYADLVEFIPREQLDQLGAFPGAVFALAARAGYMFTAAPNATPLLPSKPLKGMHGYLPTMPGMATGFIMSGPGIRKGLQVPPVRMVDVAPTVAVLMGIDLSGATGLPIAGILE